MRSHVKLNYFPEDLPFLVLNSQLLEYLLKNSRSKSKVNEVFVMLPDIVEINCHKITLIRFHLWNLHASMSF